MPKEQVYHINLTNLLEKNLTITASSRDDAIQKVEQILEDFLVTDYDVDSGWTINCVYQIPNK
jgi:hypothetical protein